MDDFSLNHLRNWIRRYFFAEDRQKAEDMILRLLKDDPDLLRDHSWEEMWRMVIRK